MNRSHIILLLLSSTQPPTCLWKCCGDSQWGWQCYFSQACPRDRLPRSVACWEPSFWCYCWVPACHPYTHEAWTHRQTHDTVLHTDPCSEVSVRMWAGSVVLVAVPIHIAIESHVVTVLIVVGLLSLDLIFASRHHHIAFFQLYLTHPTLWRKHTQHKL